MPLSSLLKSPAGTCPFCRQKAGILSREHPMCRRTYQAGWNEMVSLAAQAAASHQFDEKSLPALPGRDSRRSYGDGATVNRPWKKAGSRESTTRNRSNPGSGVKGGAKVDHLDGLTA